MKISISKVKSTLLCFLIFYMLNKNLWDAVLGFILNPLYYGVLFLTALLGLFNILKKKNPIRKYLPALIIYAIVILLNGINMHSTEHLTVGLKNYLLYILPIFSFYYCFSGVRTKHDLFKSYYLWGFITSLLAIFEYLTSGSILGGENRIYIYYDGSSSYRSGVFVGSPMVLCVMLGAALIIAIDYYYFRKKNRFIVGACIILMGMFATGSRAPLLSSILGIVIACFALFRYGGVSRKIFIALTSVSVLIVLFAIILIMFPNFSTGIVEIDTIISRFSSIFNFSTEWGNVERLVRWKYYVNVFFSKPIFGIGLAKTSPEVLSNVNVTAHGLTTESGLLARLVETGLTGTVPYYIFCFGMINCSRKALDNQFMRKNGYYYIFIAFIALYLIEDLVLQISLEIFTTFVFWLFIAYGLCQGNITQKGKEEIRSNVYINYGCNS